MGKSVLPSKCEMDLGVMVDADISFSSHVRHRKTMIFSLNYFLMILAFKNTSLLCRIYKIYINPIITYSISLYYPNSIHAIK